MKQLQSDGIGVAAYEPRFDSSNSHHVNTVKLGRMITKKKSIGVNSCSCAFVTLFILEKKKKGEKE